MCADNLTISDDARDKALYAAAVRHQFLPHATQLVEVFEQSEQWLRGKGFGRVVEIGALPVSWLAATVGEGKDATERVLVRLFTTPGNLNEIVVESESPLLSAVARATIGLGEYNHWKEDQELIKLTSYAIDAVKVAKIVVLAYTGVGAGPAALEVAALTTSVAAKVANELITSPSEAVRQYAEDLLNDAAGRRLGEG